MGLADVIKEPRYSGGRKPELEEDRQELFDIVAGVIKTKPYEGSRPVKWCKSASSC